MSKDKFDTIRFVLEIRRRLSDDAIWTLQRPMTPGDEERMRNWPSGGLVHVAHALLIESIRREAYTMAISIASTGTPPEKIRKNELKKLVKQHINVMLDRFLEGACQDALEKVKKKPTSG